VSLYNPDAVTLETVERDIERLSPLSRLSDIWVVAHRIRSLKADTVRKIELRKDLADAIQVPYMDLLSALYGPDGKAIVPIPILPDSMRSFAL